MQPAWQRRCACALTASHQTQNVRRLLSTLNLYVLCYTCTPAMNMHRMGECFVLPCIQYLHFE